MSRPTDACRGHADEEPSEMLPQDKVELLRTFSCRMCFSSLSSRYVRLLSTGVEKGFMIFLMATEVLVSWSLAELIPYNGRW